MTVKKDPEEVKKQLENDDRDVSDLWKEALKAYKGIVGFDLNKKFDNLQSMIDQGVDDMNHFHKFRHNEKKVDKLRTLFKANLDYLDAGAEQLISAATPAFPPAAAIGTALTYLLKACRGVSADYDVVVVFFQDMNSFLHRIAILKGRLPKYKPYQNCLMDVFTSFLTMCGFAHKYIELKRFKKWISNLLEGEDSDLGDARKTMDTTLARLQNATEFAILGNTEETKKMGFELRENQESHTVMLQEQMQVLGAIRDATESIQDDMSKLLKAFYDQRKERGAEYKTKSAPADQGKPPSARRIRNTLTEVEDEDHEYHVLKETMVDDTCGWVFEKPEWEQWFTEADPFLAIAGVPGTGKSHVGAIIYDKLLQEARQDTSKHTCVSHFYFREQNDNLNNFLHAIVTIINQANEQSPAVCEIINAEYTRDESEYHLEHVDDLTSVFLGAAFRKGSKNRLFVMLDGVDELEDLDEFLTFVKIIKESELRVSVVFTCRPQILLDITQVATVKAIEVKKENQLHDLKALVWNRISNLPSLKKFSRYVQQRVADKVQEAAPNMLYAEHLLSRFNSLGREGAVLRNLDKPLPADLNGIYASLVDECYRRTGAENHTLLTKFLQWITYSYSPLLLSEVEALARLWTDDESFDLDKISEPFSKFVRVGDPGTDAEARAKIQAQGGYGTDVKNLEKGQAADPDAIYNDGSLTVKFQERSMRAFFLQPPASSNLWTFSEAHRQLFLDCCKICSLKDPENTSVYSDLPEYAAKYMPDHWSEIQPEQHSLDEQVEIMEALATIMLNKHDYASLLQEYCKDDLEDFYPEDMYDMLSKWAELEKPKAKLSPDAAAWWADIAANPRSLIIAVVKGSLEKLFRAVDREEGEWALKIIHQGLRISHLPHLLSEQARKNFSYEFKDQGEDAEAGEYEGGEEEAKDGEERRGTEDEEDEEGITEEQAALGLEGLFEDVKIPPSGYRMIAEIMHSDGLDGPARVTCQKAVNKAEQLLDKIRALNLLCQILPEENPEAAYENITKCLEYTKDESVPLDVKSAVLVTKAQIEVLLGKHQEATQTFEQARAVEPSRLAGGDVLDEEIQAWPGDENALSVLKKWNPLERLTWMAWAYGLPPYDRHGLVRSVAVSTGETDFLLQVYADSIQFLDNVNAGAPLRCDLAIFYLRVLDDPENARRIVDQVLDSSSTGWPYAVTNSDADGVLGRAVVLQSDILYRLFRETSDPAVKEKLYEATENLLMRPLALDVPPESDIYLLGARMSRARMKRKIASAREFQEALQALIDTCLGALSDSVNWNDTENLVCLAQALMLLREAIGNKEGDKLKRMAEILVSAKYSTLGTDTNGDGSEEGSSEGWEDEEGDGHEDGEGSGEEGDEDDEESWDGESSSDDESEDEEHRMHEMYYEDHPEDEGHLDIGTPALEYLCHGVCSPPVMFRWWGGRTAYECMTCSRGFLCEECYEKRMALNRGKDLKVTLYCGADHEYIKAPVQGWQGILDGKIQIEGEGEVEFEELIRQIREEVIVEAWETFWRG